MDQTQEKLQEEQLKQSSGASTSELSSDEKNRLKFLRIKNDSDFQQIVKKMPPDKRKELQEKYQEIYGKEFGELEISKEEKLEINDLEKKLSSHFEQEIKDLKHVLIQAPAKKNFVGFPEPEAPDETKDSAKPDVEMARLALSHLPSELRAIFEEFFILELSGANWNNPETTEGARKNEQKFNASGGALVQKLVDPATGKDKFRIVVDRDCIYEEGTMKLGNTMINIRTPNPQKLTYLVLRAILSTISNEHKKEFDEYCKKNKIVRGIDKNNDRGWDDWLALCFSDPELAKKMDKDLFKKAQSWLKDMHKKKIIDPANVPQTQIIKSKNLDYNLAQQKAGEWIDADTGDKIKGPLGMILNTLPKNIVFETLGRGFLFLSTFFTYRMSKERYYMLLAEEDAKEVKRLLSRDLSGGDYLKMIKLPEYLNNKDRLRILILTLANKNHFQSWMLQLWLWKYDVKFRKTNGKEITEDGFDLVNRVSKAYAKSVKGPVAVAEYVQKGGKFVRFSYEQQLEKMDAILNTLALRDIQKISSDVYGNLFNQDKKDFIDLDSRLGDKKYDLNGFYASSDVKLNNLLGNNQAKNFINSMQKYARNLDEPDFLNLANAGVKALTRRFLQASRTEPVLFNMYTSPMIRYGFDKYKNAVGEPAYSKEEYERDFKKEKEELKNYNFDFGKKVKDSSFEELLNIYDDFVNEKREFPYIRGTHVSKYGKLLEYTNQSQQKISEMEFAPENKNVKEYFSNIMKSLVGKPELSVEEVDRIKAEFDDRSKTLPREKTVEVRNIFNEYFKHLENLGIIRQYQKLFAPYKQNLDNYMTRGKGAKGEKGKEQKQEILNWFYTELLPEKITASDKIKNIERLYPNLEFAPDEKKVIESAASDQEKMAQLTNIVSRKIESLGKTGGGTNFGKDYGELNLLFFDVNQAMKHPGQYNGDLPEFIQRFRQLELVPKRVREGQIANLDDLAYYLRLSKVVSDSYEQKEKAKRSKRQDSGLGYSLAEEDLMEEEETIAAAEEG